MFEQSFNSENIVEELGPKRELGESWLWWQSRAEAVGWRKIGVSCWWLQIMNRAFGVAFKEEDG